MKLSTNLAESIEKTIYESEYDGESRYLVADKQVLARIVKANVREFEKYDLDFIENCIEGEPQVNEIDVHPAKSKSQKIKGMTNESKIPGAEKVPCRIWICATRSVLLCENDFGTVKYRV